MDFLKKYEFYEEYDLKKYNTYKLSVICKYLVFINHIQELIDLLKYLKENNIKYLVLGNGSNVIFKDEYFDGVVIKLDKLNKIFVIKKAPIW